MFGSKRQKETERFYLLPGQGGHAYRRKQLRILKWTVAIGLLGAAVFGILLYWLDRPRL